MIRMYILTALRRLTNEKSYVFINIFSLALGIASFLIIALYLNSELRYDKHHSNYERIYRLTTHTTNNESAFSPEGAGPLLTQDYPQLGSYVRFRKADQKILSYEDSHYSWGNIYLADENAFEVFTHNIVLGNPETALSDRSSIAISESMAQSYFGESNPIGRILTNGGNTFRVTLVFEDLPENSHLKYDALLPYSLRELLSPGYTENYIRNIFNIRVYAYLLVPSEFDPNGFGDISDSFRDEYMPNPDLAHDTQIQRLDSIHFGPKLSNDLPSGNLFYVYGFAAVAVFILVIACINYVNLATARAIRRAGEIGMRKALGASRAQLIIQFFGESLFFASIALVLGILLLFIAIQYTSLGTLMGNENFLASLNSSSNVFLIFLFLGLSVSLISSIYPAFYLSSISPKSALTQVKQSWRTSLSIRQILIFVQLSISIGVIACTLLMAKQIRFVASKPLGFDKENRVLIELQGVDVIESLSTIRNELIENSNIIDVAQINHIPGAESDLYMVPTENNGGLFERKEVDRIEVGLNYIQGMGVELIAGRGFSEEVTTDRELAVIVNEALVEEMQWDEPIGKQLGWGDVKSTVIGVTRDFHYGPLHNEIRPLLIVPLSDDFSNTSAVQRPLERRSIVVNIVGDNPTSALSHIENTIKRFDSAHVFSPVFLDDRLDGLYQSETNLLQLTEIFAGICIAISAMGLLGLAAFTTEQRFKEIGIRKTLGSSSTQIVTLLSQPLVLLVLLAAIPSSLASYFAINSWLEKFAYQNDVDLLSFVIATAVVAAVALTTVALQSLKAAQSNPIEILRYE